MSSEKIKLKNNRKPETRETAQKQKTKDRKTVFLVTAANDGPPTNPPIKLVFVFDRKREGRKTTDTDRKGAKGKKGDTKQKLPLSSLLGYIEGHFKPIEEKELEMLEEKEFDRWLMHVQGEDTPRRPTQAALERRILASLVQEGAGDQDTAHEEEHTIETVDVGDVLELSVERNIKHLCGIELSRAEDDKKDLIGGKIKNIAAEIRRQFVVNENRKRKIREKVKNILPSQEYFLLLDTLEKKILDLYLQRRRMEKLKKLAEPQQEDLVLLEMYTRIKEKLGGGFVRREELYRTF
ncbi:MAG: uncharacterized protein A8A55_1764 [Amphiamblys sp. WSBS2006]|nr:MAG: uncharacterized protein A8A55_1764 [Amphiamblys sp. WSBS2006]